VLNREPIALMFRKDAPDFKNLVDDTIRKMGASGEMKATWAKWFQSPIPPLSINLNLEPSEAMQRLWAQPCTPHRRRGLRRPFASAATSSRASST
jgi:glutamate/aspartate transport system substrate-binding protein